MNRIDTYPHASHGLMNLNPNTEVVLPATFIVVKTFPSEAESKALTDMIEQTSKPKNQSVVVYPSAGT